MVMGSFKNELPRRQKAMRFAKPVLFTIFVAVILTACDTGSKISEQATINHNKYAREQLEFIRRHLVYVYDSETKMCLMMFYDWRGSVTPVPCLNVVKKLSPEHRVQYLADAGRHLDKVQ